MGLRMMGSRDSTEKYASVPFVAAFETYCNYATLIVFSYVAHFFRRLFSWRDIPEDGKEGYAPIVSDFDAFYARKIYSRVRDCWDRPIASPPGAEVTVLEREDNDKFDWRSPLQRTGSEIRCINLASYNYLGYGEIPGGVGAQTIEALEKYGVSTGGNSVEAKSYPQRMLEERVARFVNKEAALVVGMGFATNSQIIAGIVGPGCLILSDALNHASIIVGARNSGAKIRVFAHDDPVDLERLMRESIATGQPKTGEAWKKILIIVEGVYSMEGEICNLAEIVRVKKKYGAFLFMDEAHSIGAMGKSGRGVGEYWGVDTKDVDILMGTFTKSFGAVGGYIASSKALIDLLRFTAPGSIHATSMSPACAQHILWVLSQIMGEDGTDEGQQRILRLKENTAYIRRGLKDLGLQVFGADDSPVVPIMIYNVGKLAFFSRECLRRGLAVVVVGFPATPLLLSRARICASAAHSIEQLDRALAIIAEVATLCGIVYDTPTSITTISTPSVLKQPPPSPDSVMTNEIPGCDKLNEHLFCNGHCLISPESFYYERNGPKNTHT